MRSPTGSRWSSPSLSLAPKRLWMRVAVALGVLVSLIGSAGPAAADTVSNKQAEAARLAAQISALSLKESRLAEAYDQAQIRVQDIQTKLAAAQAGLSSTNAQLDAARQRVRDLAIASYMRGGTATELSMFVPRSTQELTDRAAYVRTVAGGTNDAIDALRAAHAQLGDQQATLTSEKAAATKALAAADSARRGAAQADAAERGLLARVQGQLATLVAAAQAQRLAAAQARLEASQRASRDRAGGFATGPLPPPPPGAAGAVEEARLQLGKPYAWGGSGPNSYDCSGLTAWAWGHAGHPLPHSSSAQYDETTHIPVSDLQPGDLVFYGSPPHHVGIYVGGGQMINALHAGTNVEYDSIYMEGDLIGGGRVN